MNKVRLEILPWLSDRLRDWGSGRLILEEEVDEGTTIRQVLTAYSQRDETFKKFIYDTQSRQLNEFVNIIINDRFMELAQGLETELKDGDTLILLPAFAGG